MRSLRVLVAVVCGLAVGLGSTVALAQEPEPEWGPPGPRRPDGEGRPDLRRPGPGRPGGPLLADAPAIREEMRRHAEAMRTLLQELRPMGQQVREKIRELRQQGADREAIREVLKEYAPKAEEVAGKIADALATHHENLARLYKENREAAAKTIARNIVRRMLNPGGPGQQPGPGQDRPFPPRRPGAEGERPFPRRPFRGGDEGGPDGGGAPENF